MRIQFVDDDNKVVGELIGKRRDDDSDKGRFSTGSTGWNFFGKVGSKDGDMYCQVTGNMVEIGSKHGKVMAKTGKKTKPTAPAKKKRKAAKSPFVGRRCRIEEDMVRGTIVGVDGDDYEVDVGKNGKTKIVIVERDEFKLLKSKG